jgi:predicted ArsR family transcriptional regulator
MAQEDEDISSVAALGDPLRRALYRYVVAQPEPVNRDQAAEALGIPRHTAKFHLDRLVTDGLLEVEFARPPGRTGLGAGRPAKYFSPAAGGYPSAAGPPLRPCRSSIAQTVTES